MIGWTPLNLLVVSSPSVPEVGYEPSHTAAALAVVTAVLVAAVVTEIVRHRLRRRVHHPVPLPRRRTGAPIERKHRDISQPPVLMAHRS